MFTIKEDWLVQVCLLDFDTGIAGKFHHSLPRKKKQPQWSFEKDVCSLWVNDNLEEALYETSSEFYCARAEALLGREFLSADAAHNYVYASFCRWWYDQKERRLFFRNNNVPVEQRTIGDDDNITSGVEMKTEWKDLFGKIEKFATEGSSDDAFFFKYLLLPDVDKNNFWSSDRSKVKINNRWVARQTFYNHLNKFKRKIATAFE